jgi:hypothetical protein
MAVDSIAYSFTYGPNAIAQLQNHFAKFFGVGDFKIARAWEFYSLFLKKTPWPFTHDIHGVRQIYGLTQIVRHQDDIELLLGP